MNVSVTCWPIFTDGFSAVAGSWYTIDAAPARNRRRSRSDILITSSPATRMRPLVITALVGRYRSAAKAVVDLPQPDSPTSPYASPGRTWKLTPLSTSRGTPRML